jgi:rhodanese-related sulfurtransferase
MPAQIDRVTVQMLLEAGAQLVDVLPEQEYEQEHQRGAMNIPLKRLDRHTVAPLNRDGPVIVYCWDRQ